MEQIYRKEVQVLEYECDLQRKVRLSVLMHHAQQIGGDHLATIGVDYRRMYDDGMVFVVNKLKIKINRRPEFGEKLLLTTIPKAPKGVQFIRDTLFDTLKGEHLAEVSISWALIDPHTRKLLRPSVFNVYGFQFNPSDGEAITSYKIHAPEGVPVNHRRQIKYTDLDYNGHVNNAVYADIMCDLLPLDVLKSKEMKEFGIIYHKEAKAKQVLNIDTVTAPDGHFYVKGKIGEERCFEAELFFQP